jgi:hypothetical protein
MSEKIKKKAFIECFSNFMSDLEGLTQEDLITELGEQNIDVSQLKVEAAEVVKRGSEEMRLGWKRLAKQKMDEIKKLLLTTQTFTDSASNVKDKITGFIKDKYGSGALIHAEAYFRNKKTLSESDLINLFDDLEQLESLDKLNHKKDQ